MSEEIFNECKFLIFADPQADLIFNDLPNDYDKILPVEFLPGQYDQRADAAQKCIMLLSGENAIVKTAKIYLFYGAGNFELAKKLLINPVEAREADLKKFMTLSENYPEPENVKILNDLNSADDNELNNIISKYNLAMSLEDLKCCQKYFNSENRAPTLTELKVVDTYWSDHCRHTTFLTKIENIEFHDEKIKNAYENYLKLREKLNYPDNKPVNLMDIATIGAKFIKYPGRVISDENNACTVKIKIDGEDWLLLFKNETHNHPTEIEPFGGAATCIGGAIRDPLSGRAYVYQAMRITGAGDPFSQTMPGKLSQREIITKAVAGYSSYGNQIGIPTGLVDEIYHENFKAKRLEVGAVIAAVPEKNIIREKPEDGDLILLLGGRTGRDGYGGATGSSVAHNEKSINTCGAEVQKGNAPEERKLQRLFKNLEFTKLIKRCNDFGAGGVSVAVGELADGLEINLDEVPLKYSGLDGTEIAVSESQERMAIVINKNDLDKIKLLTQSEDVEATVIARVNNSGRMKMFWRGNEILNLSRDFINSNGAERHINIKVNSCKNKNINSPEKNLNLREILNNLNVCSHRGLSERFDSTVGGNSVLMPFGGKFQLTPVQVMAAKISGSDTASLMSFGYDPFKFENSAFDGGYFSVLESVFKIISAGGNLKNIWLTLQEYFGRPDKDPERWGIPFSALLGALSAQINLNIAAIGGKDSMSGTFRTHENKILDVPPTLIAFAVSVANVKNIISPEFKNINSRVILIRPEFDEKNNLNLPETSSLIKILNDVQNLIEHKKIISCAVPTFGGIPAMIFKMCIGNNLGFEFAPGFESINNNINLNFNCSFIAEISDDAEINYNYNYPVIGHVIETPEIILNGEKYNLSELKNIYEAPLNKIFPVKTEAEQIKNINVAQNKNIQTAKYNFKAVNSPKFLIPVFAGTNCEYETAREIEKAGGKSEIFVIRSLTADEMKYSAEKFAEKLKNSQALILPGGFSNGDEPDGSGKFIAIFLRSPIVKSAVENLLNRAGLICGICNGFQALVKTGLLPFGKIGEPVVNLTFNKIARHQSKIVRVKIISNNSVWLSHTNLNDVYNVAISHGEGRFTCDEKILNDLAQNNQIAAQYVNFKNVPSMETEFNPSGSLAAVECITSPDGRILGRMGHVERVGESLYKNITGNFDVKFFESAIKYFRNA